MELPNKIPYYGPIYDDGFLRIEYENFCVLLGGESLSLKRSEFLMLCRLSQPPGGIVGYADLWSYIWGSRKSLKRESLRVWVYQLRRVIEPHGANIENLPEVGYRLVLPTEINVEKSSDLAASRKYYLTT